MRLSDAATFKMLASLEGHENLGRRAVATLADGKKLVSGSHEQKWVRFGTCNSETMIARLDGHDAEIRTVAYARRQMDCVWRRQQDAATLGRCRRQGTPFATLMRNPAPGDMAPQILAWLACRWQAAPLPRGGSDDSGARTRCPATSCTSSKAMTTPFSACIWPTASPGQRQSGSLGALMDPASGVASPHARGTYRLDLCRGILSGWARRWPAPAGPEHSAYRDPASGQTRPHPQRTQSLRPRLTLRPDAERLASAAATAPSNCGRWQARKTPTPSRVTKARFVPWLSVTGWQDAGFGR